MLVTLAASGVFAGMVGLMAAFSGFMGMHHFTQEHHRVHDTTFAALNGVAVIGMLAQLFGPRRNAASQLMSLVPFASLLLAAAITNGWVLSPPWLIVGIGTVLATLLHPIGDPLLVFRGARPDRVLIALVAVAVIPLLAFAWTMFGLQRAGPSEHALEGHYGFMAALSFATIGVGLLASARPAGSRPVAWIGGALPIVLGVVSLLYPDADSALSTTWAVVAIVWGSAFVAAAELRRERGSSEGDR